MILSVECANVTESDEVSLQIFPVKIPTQECESVTILEVAEPHRLAALSCLQVGANVSDGFEYRQRPDVCYLAVPKTL